MPGQSEQGILDRVLFCDFKYPNSGASIIIIENLWIMMYFSSISKM